MTAENAFECDWGAVTPELYDREQNQAVHVFNFKMLGAENRERCRQFAVGRIVWYARHLPLDCSQRVIVDTRGQATSLKTLGDWREQVLSRVRQLVPNVRVELEFWA